MVNWNTREKLLACLRSIQEFPPSVDHEIIVVDNDSTDGSSESVLNLFPAVTLIQPGFNSGYAQGNNIAFNAAKGDFLLTLNPDTRFGDLSLDTALRSLNEQPLMGCCAIRLTNPDGTTQKSVRGFPVILGVLGQLTGLDALYPRTVWGSYSLPAFEYDNPGPAPQPMGTFLLFRKSALESVGSAKKPFDERFPIFFNEVDLLFRLAEAGFGCWYEPSGGVFHHHGSSTKQVKKAMIWESHNSLRRYWEKHWRGPQRLLLPLVGGALFVAAFLRARGYDAGFRPQRHDM